MIKDIITAIKLPFLKDKELYCDLKKILGFYPGDIELYKTALMHKSIMHRNKKGKPVNNERLEFLGDAVLDAVVGDIVYNHFPGKREGFLTNTRSKLVQRETLGKLANEMGITRLIVSSGRSQSHNSYMGGNAFEALVGAMYLDKGYDKCMKFMEKRILDKLINIDKVAYKEVNFKSKLLEWSQKNRIMLKYDEVEISKDQDGNPIFIYKVMLETVEGETGKGYSKKESQQQASKLTLEKLRKDSKYLDSIFAAKTERTKMEEEPVMTVPDIEKDEKVEIKSTEVAEPSKKHNAEQPKKEQTEQPKKDRQKPKKQENNKVEKDAEQQKKPEQPKKKPVAAEQKDKPAQQNNDSSTPQKEPRKRRQNPKKNNEEDSDAKNTAPAKEQIVDDDFDLSDITSKELSKEEIIALAENAAFSEQ